MSTKTKTEPDLQLIPTSKIAAVPGFNPRGEFSRDSDEFKSFKASIKERGIETPIKVGAPDADGIYPIVFGHRRHAAAAELALDMVPAIVDTALGEKERYIAAIVENRERSEMTPVAEARALRVLREQYGLKQAKAAKVMGMSERLARNREKLLDIPEEVAELIAAGEVPLESIPHFALVAKHAPRAPMAIVDCIRGGKAVHGIRLDLLGDPGHFADALGQVAAKAGLQEIHGEGYGESKLGSLPISDEQRKELRTRYNALPKSLYAQQPGFRFGQSDRKVAKEMGCLLELTYTPAWGGSNKRTAAYIADGVLVYELAGKKLPAMKAAITKKNKEIEERRAANGRAVSSGVPSQPDADRQKQIDREQNKRKREQEMWEKANAELGEALDAMPKPKASDVDVIRLLCALALGHDEFIYEYIADGLGQVSERYAYDDSRPRGENRPDLKLVGELAEAKTGGDCIKVVLRYWMAASFVQPAGGGLEILGPMGAPLDTRALLEDVAERFGVLPEPVLKQVQERRAQRAARLKARLEQEEAAKRQQAEAEQKRKAEEAAAGDTDENAVFALIEEYPGIPSPDIVKATELKANRVYRILGDLEKAGRIKKAKGNKYEVAAAGE